VASALALALALAGSIWLGLFAFKHLEYANDLWWQFAFQAGAPRFLRASLVVVIAATVLALMRLLRPAPPPPDLPGETELLRAASIVARAPAADAALVPARR
jgi:phosphatidylglycerol lysyltransferase